MYEHVIFESGGGVVRITINRPEKYNAFNSTTLAELTDAYHRAGDDAEVGVVVLTGAGTKAFCAGGDVAWEADGSLEGHRAATEMLGLYAAMRASRKPTIARINGYAIGGGHHLAYMCDLSIASDNAIFGQNGARVGSPAQGWIVSYLVRVVGAKRARELWLMCRRYDAVTALDWGLVNAVVTPQDLDAEVQRWCDEMLASVRRCSRSSSTPSTRIRAASRPPDRHRLRRHDQARLLRQRRAAGGRRGLPGETATRLRSFPVSVGNPMAISDDAHAPVAAATRSRGCATSLRSSGTVSAPPARLPPGCPAARFSPRRDDTEQADVGG